MRFLANRMAAVILLPLVFALGACGDKKKDSGNRSVDAAGNCTQEYINDYNNVIFSAKSMGASRGNISTSGISSAVSVCNKFTSTHAGVSCRAEENYTAKTISGSNLKQYCDAVVSYNKTGGSLPDVSGGSAGSAVGVGSPATATASPPLAGGETNTSTSDDKLIVSDIGSGKLKLTVVDAEKFKSLGDGEGDLYIIQGKIGNISSLTTEIMKGLPTCYLRIGSSSALASVPKDGDVFTSIVRATDQTDGDQQSIVILFDVDNLGLGCLKAGLTKYTLKDLRDSFKGIAEFDVVK